MSPARAKTSVEVRFAVLCAGSSGLGALVSALIALCLMVYALVTARMDRLLERVDALERALEALRAALAADPLQAELMAAPPLEIDPRPQARVFASRPILSNLYEFLQLREWSILSAVNTVGRLLSRFRWCCCRCYLVCWSEWGPRMHGERLYRQKHTISFAQAVVSRAGQRARFSFLGSPGRAASAALCGVVCQVSRSRVQRSPPTGALLSGYLPATIVRTDPASWASARLQCRSIVRISSSASRGSLSTG